ncbi:hypothetical protein L6452_40284 [Arctium lappa]|uniref:Uncharacterized protein n=1 Tax=Arctium lappa TaxID=4217 RepID=A0ACB8XN91_ARCLA|nr:hypothetical protein L6452_40284 [Arctium lappa]
MGKEDICSWNVDSSGISRKYKGAQIDEFRKELLVQAEEITRGACRRSVDSEAKQRILSNRMARSMLGLQGDWHDQANRTEAFHLISMVHAEYQRSTTRSLKASRVKRELRQPVGDSVLGL